MNSSLLSLLFVIFVTIAHTQECQVNMEHYSLTDSLIKETQLVEFCIRYKTKGKNKLRVYEGKVKIDEHEILKANHFENYTELTIYHSIGAIMKLEFYKQENKLITRIPESDYYIVEYGNGLNYNIRRKATGSGKSLPSNRN